MESFLEFEKPVAELERKITELRHLSDGGEVEVVDEIIRLEKKLDQLLTSTYSGLSAWQRTLVARHPLRPHFEDYIGGLIDNFTPLAGDRGFAEDEAIIGGLGRFRGQSVVVIGNQKGRDTQSRIKHNFGMARPEGYRKAIRLMKLADRFKLPVLTLVDTSGAYPGIGAEERGQAEAIARSTQACLQLGVPLISIIVGEGGSGGAVALAAGNRVIMFEHAIYSVISPEGCASILWRTSDKAEDAANALKLTATDLRGLGVIDKIVDEPLGGAHRQPDVAIAALGNAIAETLGELSSMSADELRRDRREKFLAMGTAGVV
jgi:acetyl-CoA carboxylase carboxyl transferase subunit alpha